MDNVTITGGQPHHYALLDALKGLTQSLGPILSATIPGAAPFVIGAGMLEQVAGNILDTVDAVKNSASTVVDQATPEVTAPASVVQGADNVVTDEPVQTATITAAPPVATSEDAAALAAQAIQKASAISGNPDAMAQSIIKLENDLENLLNDLAPVIAFGKDSLSKLEQLFKQFGL